MGATPLGTASGAGGRRSTSFRRSWFSVDPANARASLRPWAHARASHVALFQHQVRVDRPTAPPLALGLELEDGEVQMRCVRRGIARGPDVADDVATPHRLSVSNAV